VISLTIARKYAKALLKIGLQEKNHEILGRELERLAGLFQENKELRLVLLSPFYPAPRRKAIARSVGESLGYPKRPSISWICSSNGTGWTIFPRWSSPMKVSPMKFPVASGRR